MAGIHGSRSNYADRPSEGSGLTEHRLNLANDSRAFTPDSGERDGEGTYSNLALYATGDWSWKPFRYKSDPGVVIRAGHVVDRRGSLEAQMPTWQAPDWMRESDAKFVRRMRWAV